MVEFSVLPMRHLSSETSRSTYLWIFDTLVSYTEDSRYRIYLTLYKCLNAGYGSSKDKT